MNLFIIGGGAWGTALGTVAAHTNNVTLFVNEKHICEEINSQNTTPYLPQIILSKKIFATTSMKQAQYADIIFIALPAQIIRFILTKYNNILQNKPFVSCSKGFERNTHKAIHEIIQDIFPTTSIAVLGGPNFAHEIAKGLPASFTLASQCSTLKQKVAQALKTNYFHPEFSDDVIGLETLSAFKNILALVGGMARGLSLGENATAMLITRGIYECIKLLIALGGKQETILTMGGIGDILLTCTSTTSRNASFGYVLAKYNFFQDADPHKAKLAEGVYSTQALFYRAKEQKLLLPILEATYDIIERNLPVKDSIEKLINYPLVC